MNQVFPSILSTDYFDLKQKLDLMQKGGVDFLHLDVMDGHFVDNISFGPALCASLKRKYPFKIDAHLMVSNPQKIVPFFIESGADWISFHLEAVPEPEQLIKVIRSAGRKAGLVINPPTPVEKLFFYLEEVDFVLLMSVNPGFGGQSFISATLPKISALADFRWRKQLGFLIQVDGGINLGNSGQIISAGADILIIGSALYNSSDLVSDLQQYKAIIQGAWNEKKSVNFVDHPVRF